MRNTYSPWEELAGMPDVTLEWHKLANRLGEYVHAERKIRLDPRLPRRQQRAVLCHELRHAAAGHWLTACSRVNLRQEHEANNNAARLLIDVHDLGDALVLHHQHLSATAVELRVSDALLQVRLENLHPSEIHFLRRRFEDLA